MPDRISEAGLHIASDALLSKVYFNPATLNYAAANREIHLTTTMTTGLVYHSLDGGRRDITWNHDDFIIPHNTGVGAPPNGPVTVGYYYSNSLLDVDDSNDRATIDANVSAYFDDTTILLEDAGVGRYRYLRFFFSRLGAEADAFLAEWGGIQTTTQPIEIGDTLILVVDNQHAPLRVEFPRGTTPTFVFQFQTSYDPGAARYDLTGATVQVSIAKSSRKAFLDGAPLVGPLSATIDNDPTTGLASITLGTTVAETDLEPGDYLMEVLTKKGAQRFRHFVTAGVLAPVTVATT